MEKKAALIFMLFFFLALSYRQVQKDSLTIYGTFDEALDQIANSSDQLGTSFDLFKKKGSTIRNLVEIKKDFFFKKMIKTMT